MSNSPAATYHVDGQWRIVLANEPFCRLFHCTESSLIGRDVRELLRSDWRHDFRIYVAQALVGVGAVEVTLPMVAPCGSEGWFSHELEPLVKDGVTEGYRASIRPHGTTASAPAKHWWQRRAAAPNQAWDDADQLAEAS